MITAAGPSAATPTVLVLVAVVSIIGTLLVTLVAERVRRAVADRRWLLDHRHEAYVDFLAISADANVKITMYGLERSRDAFKELAEVSQRQIEAWFRVISIGEYDATILASDVLFRTQELIDAVEKGDPAGRLEAQRARGHAVMALAFEINRRFDPDPLVRRLFRRGQRPPMPTWTESLAEPSMKSPPA